MIGIFAALLGAVGWLGGNMQEQWQNDQARVNSMRNPNNPTGTYMDFRGRQRDAKTNKPVILSGDGRGNILVKDIHGVTMRVCKLQHDEPPKTNQENYYNKWIPYNLRYAHRFPRKSDCAQWHCSECGAWNDLEKDTKCNGCGKDKAEDDREYQPGESVKR